MYKFGIIGCGIIAPFHARAIQATTDAELYAVCDIVPQKADDLAKEFNVPKIYYDYREMLQDKEINAVCICTPSGTHGEIAIASAICGKHILCEKPLEITKEKLDNLIFNLSKYNVKVGCVFQRRFQPIPVMVKEAIDKGIFGKCLLADTYLKYYRSPEYYKSAGWRATWELDGGGALMNQGVHGIDLINWFMGGIDSVSAITSTQMHNIKVEDAAIAITRFKNGAIGVIEGTTCVNPGQSTRFELHFEKGSIIFNDSGLLTWNLDGKDYSDMDNINKELNLSNDPKAIGSMSHLPIVQDFVASIKEDRPPMIEPNEGRKAIDIILAIYKSSTEGKTIYIR